MRNFIEELLFCNIDPQSMRSIRGSRHAEPSTDINTLEEQLMERLQGEEKSLFLSFSNAYAEAMGKATVEYFVTGFRLGARFAVDTFCEGTGDVL